MADDIVMVRLFVPPPGLTFQGCNLMSINNCITSGPAQHVRCIVYLLSRVLMLAGVSGFKYERYNELANRWEHYYP